MDLLTGTMRHYPWGSREYLANLRGQSTPSERPEAELWFGAHPGGSASIGGQNLIDVIAADPEGNLGARVRSEYGDGLPFLLKLLAAGEPLSLQAHPSLTQAQEGYARENYHGIALDADNRNYKDANHKPELIVALTEFEAMAGFRPLDKTLELFEHLGSAELERYVHMLDGNPAHESGDLRMLFTTWITIPSSIRTRLIDDIVASCALALADDDLPDWMCEELSNVVALHTRYPYDVGVLGALLLNKFTLQPGEGVYLDAGQLHAYVKGLGVEVMANSDNVLRGGLTSKHVDVPELVHVLDFNSLQDPRSAHTTQVVTGGVKVSYQIPINEFLLDRFEAATAPDPMEFEVDSDGPAVLLVTDGTAILTCGSERLEVSAGDAAWIPAKDPLVTVHATGTVFLATV